MNFSTKKLKALALLAVVFCTSLTTAFAQDLDDLMNEIDNEESSQKVEYTTATFKSSRIINLHSTEMTHHGSLDFRISHRFGKLNDGTYGIWGLDQSTIRFGFEYGVNKFITLGFARSSLQKTYEGSAKIKLLRQSTGAKNMPISLAVFSSVAARGLEWSNPNNEYSFAHRLAYTHQILLASKISERISLQLAPSFIHKNLVKTANEANGIWAVGVGGRVKLTDRLALTAEYIYLLTDNVPLVNGLAPVNSTAIGIDIETGGHVFQIQLTNSMAMYEKGYITESLDTFKNGGIHLGFNILRAFTVHTPKD